MAAPSPEPAAQLFQLRAVTLDYYLAPPRAPFGLRPTALQGETPDEVPVLRVFGATPGGQRACLHLHGAMPHFYIRYEDDFPQDDAGVRNFVAQLSHGLDVALRRYAVERREAPRRHHVASAALVSARPFYGFHREAEPFVKIELLNPGEVTRAAALLADKAVLNRAFAVHEAHVPFILQVMMDLNFAGMALLSLPAARVVFRGELPAEPRLHQRVEPRGGVDAHGEPVLEFCAAAEAQTPEGGSGGSVETPGPQLWTRARALAGRALCSREVAPQTTCELEADALARDVLNRVEALRVPLEEATPDMQLVQSLGPLWAEEKLRAAAAGLPPPRRGSSPERSPTASASELVQRARAAIKDAADAERAELAAAGASAAPAQGRPAERGRGSLMACTQAANSLDLLRDPAPARSASVTTVDGPPPASEAPPVDDVAIMTQAQHDSQQRDDEVGALLQHLFTSPQGGHRLVGAEEVPAAAELGSQELRSPHMQEELAAFAADHELYSEHDFQELREQYREDMLKDQRDADAIMHSQLLLPEPEPSDSEHEPPHDDAEEDTPEKPQPKRSRRAASSQQQAADRLLMPPPAPRPPRGKAARKSSADGAQGSAGSDSQASLERPSPTPPRILRWNRPAPSTAALRQDLVQHGLHEYVPDAYRSLALSGSTRAKSASMPQQRSAQPAARSRRGLAAWRAELSDPTWQAPRPDRSARAAPRRTRMYMLTPARRAPSRAELLPALQPPSQPAASGAPPSAAPAPAGGELDPGSDDEWEAFQKSLAAAAAANGPGSAARISTVLCHGDEGTGSGAARPASPKYEERVDYLQALKFYGCEPMPEAAQVDSAATPAPAPPAAAAADPAPAQPALAMAQRGRSRRSFGRSQITPPSRTHASTSASQAGFAVAGSQAPAHVTVMVLEVFAAVRDGLLADPQLDPVQCVSICLSDDGYADGDILQEISIVVDEEIPAPRHCVPGSVSVHSVPSEDALLQALTSLVRALDPDFIIGFDVHAGSLGYLTERCDHLGGAYAGLLQRLSRTPQHMPPGGLRVDDYGRDHGAGIWVTGRCVLNFWRIARSELGLGSYTFEAAMMALLQRRVPAHPRSTLGAWYAKPVRRWRVIADLAARARGCLLMCTQLDLVGRTSELARVFGIDFNSVITRGSQYRVESMMLRLAHTQNYLALSPSKEALASSNGPAIIALVMDPASGYYTSPVVVLDFQSLYPSQVIAYNLCFSTCLGMAPPRGGGSLAGVPRKFGAAQLALEPGVVPELYDKLHITPNGAMFVPPSVRPGVLPRMLSEILDTRIMVKAALKSAPATARVLQRILTARQLGLKLIANVTYGYTAANFSGRMPLVDLADAIVSSGRDTLERAINLVKSHAEWRAEVVYGDTDSMFVHLPGRSRAEAFRIGAEIAAAVTAANPKPVKLQLEKVYEPCILVTKKRYVGMAYASATSEQPTFDAKGIETVRRDSCGLVAKTMERSLRLLFATHDLDVVRQYLERQWAKVLAGRMSVADAVFAREVRLGTYAAERTGVKHSLPPGALVAERARARDPRAVPPYGQRVPYVVVEGPHGASVSSKVHSPHDFLAHRGKFKLCAKYYINLQCNALSRLLSLAGGDLERWVASMPVPKARSAHLRAAAAVSGRGAQERNMITAFYSSDQCSVCGTLVVADTVLCDACKQAQPDVALLVLHGRVSKLETQVAKLHSICMNCGGDDGCNCGSVSCESLDCPVLYERRKREHELASCQKLLKQATDW